MGRPPKYSTLEEREEAHRSQKLTWYHNRGKLISLRRKRARALLAGKLTPVAGPKVPKIGDYEGTWPSQYIQHLQHSLQHAPAADSVENACAYWRLALNAFTRDDMRAWNMELLGLMLEMSNEEIEASPEWNLLCNELDRLGDIGGKLVDAAFTLDPSGCSEVYGEASKLDRDFRKLNSSVGEMVLLRRDSRRLLEEMKLDGLLICQTM